MRTPLKKRTRLSIRGRTLLLQPNRLLRGLYPRALWRFASNQKFLCLTFDDGPIELTQFVLDELKKYDAKATFFCVGENVEKHPKIYERLLAEGHLSANHTQHHVKGFKTSVAGYMEEVDKCQVFVNSTYFRPPYGQLKASQYKALNSKAYKIVMWDVISYDYETITEEQCLENVLRNAREGSIVLFHDNIKAEKNLKYALPRVLAHYHNLGYKFLRIDEAETAHLLL